MVLVSKCAKDVHSTRSTTQPQHFLRLRTKFSNKYVLLCFGGWRAASSFVSAQLLTLLDSRVSRNMKIRIHTTVRWSKLRRSPSAVSLIFAKSIFMKSIISKETFTKKRIVFPSYFPPN